MTELRHLPVELTDTQRANLARLADYLETVPQSAFDMESFEEETDCGTVACAVGHGPAAGFPKPVLEAWTSYSSREFAPDSPAWDWCFFGRWSETDNTPQGAAARIRYMLEHGVPENYEEQMCGDEPLSYEVTA